MTVAIAIRLEGSIKGSMSRLGLFHSYQGQELLSNWDRPEVSG